MYVSYTLPIENEVTVSDAYVPLTGVYSVSSQIAGWQWDQRRISSLNLDASKWNTYLGGHKAGLLNGTKLSDWQSGVVAGIDFLGIERIYADGEDTWTPVYSVGEYTTHWCSDLLYSDYSVSKVVDNRLNELDRNVAELDADAVYSSISAAIYKRNEQAVALKAVEIDLVDVFTGELSGDSRLDTMSGDVIEWANVSSRKNEMMVHDGKLYFNKDFTFQIGLGSDLTSIRNTWEDKGNGLSTGRNLFLEYFGVQRGSVQLVSIDDFDAITTWTEVDNLNFSQSTDKHFSVNYDLGIITTSGFKAPDLFLATAIDELDTEIEVHLDKDALDQYPPQGILVIGGEKILYVEKTSSGFRGLVRGYDGTTPASHAAGVKVQDVQHGQATTSRWYVLYTASPVVRYEISNYLRRTANKSQWLDLFVLNNISTNNTVQLSTKERELSKIVLSTDRQRIGANLYGPILYGTDVAELVATAYDSSDQVVSEIPITIEKLYGPGVLNGFNNQVNALSDELGRVSCFYNTPYSSDNTDITVTSVVHDGADTVMTVERLDGNPTVDDIWIFQILKHDPVFGSIGDKYEAFEVSGAAAAQPYIDVYTTNGDSYIGGLLFLLAPSGVKYRYEITNAYSIEDSNGIEGIRFFVDKEVKAAYLGVPTSTCFLFHPDAIQWNSSLLNGVKVVLYEWNSTVEHPITGELGAYYPVKPDFISGKTLRFNGRNLAIPAPRDDSSNLGGYIAVAPAEARFRAYGRDPYSGKMITSNEIKFRLSLGGSLTGVDTTGALPIPYGWTLYTEDFNVGSGLGGANFVTINPAASGINQFSITGAF